MNPTYINMLKTHLEDNKTLQSLKSQLFIPVFKWPYFDILNVILVDKEPIDFALCVTEIEPFEHAHGLYATAKYMVFHSENHRVNFMTKLALAGIKKNPICITMNHNTTRSMLYERKIKGHPLIIQPDSDEGFKAFLTLYRLMCHHAETTIIFATYSAEYKEALITSMESDKVIVINMAERSERLSADISVKRICSLDVEPTSPFIESLCNGDSNHKLNNSLALYKPFIETIYNPSAENHKPMIVELVNQL